MDKFSNLDLMYYAIKILIIFAKTSDLSPMMKQIRVNQLEELRKEVGLNYD